MMVALCERCGRILQEEDGKRLCRDCEKTKTAIAYKITYTITGDVEVFALSEGAAIDRLNLELPEVLGRDFELDAIEVKPICRGNVENDRD